jgi:hypothetical protein
LSYLKKDKNQPSAQTDSRAAACRLLADVASDDPATRAWALNNAAEIYLRFDEYSEAENLSRRALNAAEELELDHALPVQQLRELRWKAALTVSLAADKLGHEDEALKFCKISIESATRS